jgi:hypothetical protein
MTGKAFEAEAHRQGCAYGGRFLLARIPSIPALACAAIALMLWIDDRENIASKVLGIVALSLVAAYWLFIRPFGMPPKKIRCPSCGGAARLENEQGRSLTGHWYMVCPKADTEHATSMRASAGGVRDADLQTGLGTTF